MATGGEIRDFPLESYTYDATTGNLASKGPDAYTYSATHKHAVTAAGGKTYAYDDNGNMTSRTVSGQSYNFGYDAENHMIGISGGTVNATFLYDGDGRRVQSTVNGVTTQFVGSHVEWQNSTTDMVRYYYAGGVRVAMRTGEEGLVWLVGDHLGSTSIAVTDASGATEYQGYRAWGETRFGSLPTKYQYTGQYNEPELGLYYYGARWYDSYLNRWAQPDSIIPDISNPVDWDRYAYVRNNPIKYIDPSGHNVDCAVGETECLEQVKAEEAYKAAMIEEYGEEYYQYIARQDHLFARLFSGPRSGQSSWTAVDWRYYFAKRKSLWNSPPGDESFPVLLLRLASHYSNAQKDQFVKDMALIFGGIPTASRTPSQAAWASKSGPPLPILNVTNQGLKDEYIDTKNKRQNQSHHYAGIFFLGYFFGASFATDVNYLRDFDNSGDILLGNKAASQGAGFAWSDISSLMYYIYELWSEE